MLIYDIVYIFMIQICVAIIHDVISNNVVLNHFGGITGNHIFLCPKPLFKFTWLAIYRIILIINWIDVLRQQQGRHLYGFKGTKRKTSREPSCYIICNVSFVMQCLQINFVGRYAKKFLVMAGQLISIGDNLYKRPKFASMLYILTCGSLTLNSS